GLARYVRKTMHRVERHAAARPGDLDRLEDPTLPERHDPDVVLAVSGGDGPVEAAVGRDGAPAGEVPEPNELARRNQLVAVLEDVLARAYRLVLGARQQRLRGGPEPDEGGRRREHDRSPAPHRAHEAPIVPSAASAARR